MRFHLVSLPHTQTTAEYVTCAYTQKIRKLAKMLVGRGHEVVLYSGPENDAPCTEHVVVERKTTWQSFASPTWPTEEQFAEQADRAIPAIRERAEARDFLLLLGGHPQRRIADALPGLLTCEPGVGYRGVFARFVAFESYAWMHHVYGEKGWTEGRWYDAVIPNLFDREEFPELGDGSGGYLAFAGRLNWDKGVTVAAEIARRVGMPLLVAGPGVGRSSEGLIEGNGFTIEGDVHYVGVLGIEERAAFMRDAVALLAPTIYVEPFGGVAVEAMLCGTPAVTSDWGAFVETVAPEFRFRTPAEGVEAVERAVATRREPLREAALARYSIEALGPAYELWFARLATLWEDGWNTTAAPRSRMAA